jgi:hypothetical protein
VRKWAIRIALGAVALLALSQAVPYGRSHTNPPVSSEPRWDAPATRQLAADACFDCHSNLTRWPWYTSVAPMSWLTQNDVDGGRSTLNFSEWDKPQDAGAGDIVEAARGSMPPWFYKPMHPASNLSSAERDRLVAGLVKTLQASPPLGGGGGG